jgi:hypothetical protein
VKALAEVRRAWELDSNSLLVNNLASLALLEMGEMEQANRIARRPVQASFQRGTLGYVLARTGAPEEAGGSSSPSASAAGAPGSTRSTLPC